ncbi:hypothetical protein ETB97_004253 [Aspergillus alliaceus]|uniref:Uncharacterized protein n=1 Tax=Petromyces alliaceus TaxID=209559 RepID=A0A8H6E404_PETAA|nr:hypothetical protein ETB97_004253 [Aspergillus burnettii]
MPVLSTTADVSLTFTFSAFFYLLVVYPQRTNQIWLTSVLPDDLVKKYTEYAHGNSQGERRIVLDKYMLPDMFLVNNLHVVPREDLLERSLNTVKEQAEIAQRESEQLCILIFGHRDEDLSVFIGGVEGPHKGPPTLTMGNLSRLLPKDLARPLNVTGITAASDKNLSYFWPISKSIDRASGGLAASVILQCLIDAEEAAEEATLHPTYAALSD